MVRGIILRQDRIRRIDDIVVDELAVDPWGVIRCVFDLDEETWQMLMHAIGSYTIIYVCQII